LPCQGRRAPPTGGGGGLFLERRVAARAHREELDAVEFGPRAVLAVRDVVDQDAADGGAFLIRQHERRHHLLVLVQRRHVEQHLPSVDALLIEQDQIDAEAVQLVSRAVVEQEQRPATLVRVLELVQLDQELALVGGLRGRDRHEAERRTKRGGPRSQRREAGDLFHRMVFRADGRTCLLASPTRDKRRIASFWLYTQGDALSSAGKITLQLNRGCAGTSRTALFAERGADMSKTAQGNFFEDFAVGQEIVHATPRTVTESDATLYLALTGSRFGVQCSATLARMAGLPRPPLDDLLTFHLAFGRSVPDVSL